MASYKPYIVRCSAKGCQEQATYKIAAAWTDGNLVELKPYSFACEGHLQEMFLLGQQKRAQCRVSHGERIDPVGVYRLDPRTPDRQLARLTDLEARLSDNHRH